MIQSPTIIENQIFKIISPEKFLKFYADKDTTKDSLNFQLTSVSGKIPKLQDKKIYNIRLSRIGQKRKRQMTEPIETVSICAQQNFEIACSLNPAQIEIEDDKVLNILKKKH